MFRDPVKARDLPVSPPTGVPVSRKPVSWKTAAIKLTRTQHALLAFLERSLEGMYRGLTAGEVGAELWPDRKGRICATGGGGDYAAQMLLGRMRKEKLVRVQPRSITSVWELTGEGLRRAIRTAQDAGIVVERKGRPR